VEDKPSIRRALERLLRSAGHLVKTFASAREFFDYGDTKDGILILDLDMPDRNEFDLRMELATVDANIPILLLTAHYGNQAQHDAMLVGAHAIIQKPFDGEDLLDAVNLAIQDQR